MQRRESATMHFGAAMRMAALAYLGILFVMAGLDDPRMRPLRLASRVRPGSACSIAVPVCAAPVALVTESRPLAEPPFLHMFCQDNGPHVLEAMQRLRTRWGLSTVSQCRRAH